MLTDLTIPFPYHVDQFNIFTFQPNTYTYKYGNPNTIFLNNSNSSIPSFQPYLSSNLYLFPMENSTIQSLGLIDIFMSRFFSNWVVTIPKFISKYHCCLRSKQLPNRSEILNVANIKQVKKFEMSNEDTDDGLTREDIEMVMGKLGLFCCNEEEKIQEKLGTKEISMLFEEQEPSFEEVKEAFCVFDENRDGFIDAEELQRVLCVLRLREGSDMDNCRMMIRAFDKNGDGKIDFDEFVKVMEITLC